MKTWEFSHVQLVQMLKACNWALLLHPATVALEQRYLWKRHEIILATKADRPRPPSSLVQHINVLGTLQQQIGTLPTEIDGLQRIV